MELEVNMSIYKEYCLLSVVVPAYNAEEYLASNLMSMEEQTVSKDLYAIIIINDGSTDQTANICRSFADKYSNIIYLEKVNGGVSSARNLGIQIANTEWISFVDSDDYVAPNYVETLLGTKDADLIIFNNYLDANGRICEEKNWMYPFKVRDVEKTQIIKWTCDQRINAPWDKRYRLSVVKNNGIHFMDGLNMGEDLLFNLEYLLRCETILINESCIYYHTDNVNGLCHRKANVNRLKEFELIYAQMVLLCIKFNLDKNYFDLIKLSFLRNITSVVGEIWRSKYKKTDIENALKDSFMVQEVLEVNTSDTKDVIRKGLINCKMYRVCALLF